MGIIQEVNISTGFAFVLPIIAGVHFVNRRLRVIFTALILLLILFLRQIVIPNNIFPDFGGGAVRRTFWRLIFADGALQIEVALLRGPTV